MSDYSPVSQSELTDLLESNASLFGIEVDGLEFDPEQVEELNAEKVIFRNCRWIECDFSGSRFKDCQFIQCSFARSELDEVEFDHCNLFDAKSGAGTDFAYTNLREAKFKNCNLSAANFDAADLYDLSIIDCKANGCKFENATFTRTFGRTQRVSKTNLVATIFDDSNFSGIDFESCNLSKSSFSNADLTSCIFAEADLSECDLGGAMLRRANFDRTDLRGAQLEGFSLGLLSGYDGVKISEDQTAGVLAHLGVQVYP